LAEIQKERLRFVVAGIVHNKVFNLWVRAAETPVVSGRQQ